MKHLIPALCCFLAFIACEAQNKKIDSLNLLIGKAVSDTQRINLTINKIEILSNINLDTAILLGKQTLEIAQKINYYKGELSLREKLAINYCYKGMFSAAEDQLNFLEQFTKPTSDSIDFAEQYATWGMLNGMQSRYDSSILWYEKAIRILERANNKLLLPSAYSNIAIGYQQQSDFAMALVFQQKALQLAEANKNEVSQARTLMNMGNTYEGLRDSSRAEEHFLKAIELAKKNSLINVELYGYSNLASLYIKQANWQKAYEFALKAAELGGSMGDQGIQAASLSKAATALASMNKLAEAENLSKKAITIADSSAQPMILYQAYSGMGYIHRMKGSYAEAILYFEKGFLAMKGSDMFSYDYGDTYKQLSHCYEKTGNYGKALENYKIATDIVDSARSKDNIRKATELTMNYEFEKKQQIQHAVQKAKDDVAQTRQLALVLGLALMLILAIVALVGFKNKQKSNALLKTQKNEIEQTLTMLKSTQSLLIQSEKMASLGQLTAGIAHEIQNPLNFVNNFSELNRELLSEMSLELEKGNIPEARTITKEVIANESKILTHGKRADAIVKGMLLHSRSSTGLKEPTDINALADEYLRLAYHGLRAKDKTFNATIKTDFDQTIGKINIIPQDVGRVILNLISNAFYVVAEKQKQGLTSFEPTVTVKTVKNPPSGGKGAGTIEVIVKDNGMGIYEDIKDKIFQPFFTTKPPGQGTGLGLSLSYDIVKAHGGELKVETLEGEGSEFIIILPNV